MTTSDFEPRPLYGIGTVARLTGLKPDTLRVWERRYGLGASHKSPSGRRQYTQADLDHLQLVAALVRDGARIGEIAGSERKTLEMMLRQQQGRTPVPRSAPRRRVVFVGASLCSWLDGHPGLLANVDARLARGDLDSLEEGALEILADCDVAVLELAALSRGGIETLAALQRRFPGPRIVACYRFGNERWLEELERLSIVPMPMPPDPGRLAFEIARVAAVGEAEQGESNVGELVVAKPRRYSSQELAAARTLKSNLDCECPRHIADLIEALATFEEYSAACSVDNWHDAAVHACIYAFTGQARHLMEKAMQSVLEERGDEFRVAVARLRSAAAVTDAA